MMLIVTIFSELNPKLCYNSRWLIVLHSKAYFCQSSAEFAQGAPTVPTYNQVTFHSSTIQEILGDIPAFQH